MTDLARLDLEMPGETKWRSIAVIKKEIEAGLIESKTIDDRARAVLQLLEKTGKFADRREQLEEKAVDLQEHRDLIREAGAEGIVLLKNDGGILPLDKSKCKKVALLGPLAKYPAAHGGGSASMNPHYKVSPFEAFTKRVGPDVEITYSKGMTMKD
jgi:beta-glucosidase